MYPSQDVILGAAERRSGQPALGITVGGVEPADTAQVNLDHLAVPGVIAGILGLLLLIAAAVLITMVIRRISDWQSTPRQQW